jgi:hypothetical protein
MQDSGCKVLSAKAGQIMNIGFQAVRGMDCAIDRNRFRHAVNGMATRSSRVNPAGQAIARFSVLYHVAMPFTAWRRLESCILNP